MAGSNLSVAYFEIKMFDILPQIHKQDDDNVLLFPRCNFPR